MPDIKVFRNRLEAETAKSLLESHGIGAMVSADDCGGLRPDLSLASGVRLVVGEEQVARALAILECRQVAETSSDVPRRGS